MLVRFQTRREAKPADLFLANQVHGVRALRVTNVDSLQSIAGQDADALWTTEPGILVGVKTADCGPVLLAHGSGACVAAIHAGWRGAVAGIVPKTLQEICEKLDLKPSDFKAEIGPCIGYDNYEIGSDVAVQISEEFLKPGQGDRSYFNLRGLLAEQLKHAGLKDIIISEHCTYSEPENYCSARRGDSERQYASIRL